MPNSSHGRRIRNSGRTVLGRFFMSLRTADRRVSPHPSSHRGTPGLCIASCLSRGFGSFESVIASPTAAGVLPAHGSRCAHAALDPPGRGLLVPSHDGATRLTRHTLTYTRIPHAMRVAQLSHDRKTYYELKSDGTGYLCGRQTGD